MKGRIAAWLGPKEVPVVEQETPHEKAADKEANIASNAVNTPSETERESDEISLNVQAGIQDIEAFAKVWTKRDLILAYIT